MSKYVLNKKTLCSIVEGIWANQGPEHSYQLIQNRPIDDSVLYGDNIPGWREKLLRGEDATTSLLGTRYTVKHGYFEWVMKDSSLQNVYGSATGPGYTPDIDPLPVKPSALAHPDAELQAQLKLTASVKAALQRFSGGKFLAELKDSMELVLHPVHTMYSHTWDFAGKVRKLGKVYAHRPKTYAKKLSEAWLTYSFVLKPAVQDADDAAAALNELIEDPRPDLRKVKGYGRVDENVVVRKKVGSGLYPATYTMSCLTDERHQSTVSFKGAIKQRAAGTRNLCQLFGVDFFDIAPSAWEGIPWSFLIDYFSNISGVLDSLTLLNVEQAWLMRTVRNSATKTTQMEWWIDGYHPPTWVERLDVAKPNVVTATVCQRAPALLSYQIPPLTFHMPFPSLQRALNLTALVGLINDSRYGTTVPTRFKR